MQPVTTHKFSCRTQNVHMLTRENLAISRHVPTFLRIALVPSTLPAVADLSQTNSWCGQTSLLLLLLLLFHIAAIGLTPGGSSTSSN